MSGAKEENIVLFNGNTSSITCNIKGSLVSFEYGSLTTTFISFINPYLTNGFSNHYH